MKSASGVGVWNLIREDANDHSTGSLVCLQDKSNAHRLDLSTIVLCSLASRPIGETRTDFVTTYMSPAKPSAERGDYIHFCENVIVDSTNVIA